MWWYLRKVISATISRRTEVDTRSRWRLKLVSNSGSSIRVIKVPKNTKVIVGGKETKNIFKLGSIFQSFGMKKVESVSGEKKGLYLKLGWKGALNKRIMNDIINSLKGAFNLPIFLGCVRFWKNRYICHLCEKDQGEVDFWILFHCYTKKIEYPFWIN